MERKILFRGQHRRKGERVWMDGTPVESRWIYGGVCQGEGDFSIIYQTEPDIHKFPVYTDTLGQFTGLYDATKWESLSKSEQREWLRTHTADEWKGRRIFEGDIVTGTAYSFERVGVIVWIDEIAGFGIKYRKREEPAAWENTSILKQLCKGRNDQFAAAVIGNIHDNPELMKGDEDNE